MYLSYIDQSYEVVDFVFITLTRPPEIIWCIMERLVVVAFDVMMD